MAYHGQNVPSCDPLIKAHCHQEYATNLIVYIVFILQNYNMHFLQKGMAFIVNIDTFPADSNFTPRRAADIDYDNIKHLFTELGYEVQGRENLKAQVRHNQKSIPLYCGRWNCRL